MTVSNANDIADFFVFNFQQAGDPLTNLKLQKLLYYAQGWHLALKGEPLFNERIEAWPHGPVVPPIYGKFKKFQWNPIVADITEPPLGEEIASHLKEVMDVYGVHGAWYLEKLTHQERPWIETRGNIDPTEFCTNVIPPETMKSFFLGQLQR